MKKLLFAFLLTVLAAPAYAQFSSTMQNGAVANANGNVLQTTNMGTAVLYINCSSCGGGTQINFEALGNGETWFAILGNKIGTTTTATTTTTSGTQLWSFDVAGIRQIRARISAYSAGTITVRGDAVLPDGSDAAGISASATGATNIGATTDVACIATDATPCTVIGALKGNNLLLQTAVGSTIGSWISDNSDVDIVIKASAGTLYGLTITNSLAAVMYVRLYNLTSPTCSSATGLVGRFIVPAATTGSGVTVQIPAVGITFSTGISACATTTVGDTNATAIAANSAVLTYQYN